MQTDQFQQICQSELTWTHHRASRTIKYTILAVKGPLGQNPQLGGTLGLSASPNFLAPVFSIERCHLTRSIGLWVYLSGSSVII